MKLGEKITILRKARGFSQEQLGLSLASKDNGVSRQTVSDWENGKTEPKLDNIRALADLLNVSFDALLDDELDLNNPEYLNEVLGNSAAQSREVLSDSNYFIYKRSFGLPFIGLLLLVIGLGAGLMIPSFAKASEYFAESSSRGGASTVMGQNLQNSAFTWLSIGILGAVIVAIGAPIAIAFLIRDLRKNKSCGVLNKKELVLYPRGNKMSRTIKIPLVEIEGLEKDRLCGVYVNGKEKVHMPRIKNRNGLIETFTSYKG